MTEEMTEAPLTIENLETGMHVQGKVTFLAVYGAMVDIGVERDALLHISQLGRNDFRNIEDVFNLGDEVEAFVLKVDNEDRIALTTEKPPALPWSRIKKGETYPGTVTRIENYGAFIDIGAERDGMVHVSELTDGYVQSPEDVVKIGDEVEVRVIKLDRRKRQIDLSMKTPAAELEEILMPEEDLPTAMEIALRRAQEEAGVSRRRNKKKQRRDRRDRYDQDDIVSRTLRNHRD